MSEHAFAGCCFSTQCEQLLKRDVDCDGTQKHCSQIWVFHRALYWEQQVLFSHNLSQQEKTAFDKIKKWNSLVGRGDALFFAAKEMRLFVIIILPTPQLALGEHSCALCNSHNDETQKTHYYCIPAVQLAHTNASAMICQKST